MKYRRHEETKQREDSSPALSTPLIAVAALTAMAISLFVSFSLFLAALGYYRIQPHYLAYRPSAPPGGWNRPEIHAAPDGRRSAMETDESRRSYAAGIHNGVVEAFLAAPRLGEHRDDAIIRPFSYSAGGIRLANAMRPLLAVALGNHSGDRLFDLATAALPVPRQVVTDCRLCDLIYGIVLRHGVPESAVTVEYIQPSILHRNIITRITAFLTAAQTPEILKQAIECALQGTGITINKQVLSAQRTLLQAHYANTLCVELLCVIPAPESVIPDIPQPPVPTSDRTAITGVPNAPSPETEEQDTEDPQAVPGGASGPAPEGSDTATSDNEAEDLCPEGEVPIIGYVAIILDDGGYGGDELERVLSLDNRLTLAILPDTPFARETAERATEKGFEIILHMPMQSGNGGKNRFPGELQVTMTKEQIQQRARECIAQFPEAAGVNNHTGGLFTTYAEQMGWFLEIVQQEAMYFVDSRTVGSSRAYDKAIEMGIPCASRDVFLDHNNSISEVRKQFNELMAQAKRNGWAVSIGHFRPNTITVLAEELPKLAAQGIELIPMSEMVW
ncbi:MAG: Divergent polysaccharide deacetylase [Candidatus Hydrogenedentes bacterium ADurb.Bin179]|nr:MAG: Divergent polysaccharide deacetylase [Candidatus Hydrogenedentes bacterium ADurb.Bin179]